MPQTLQNLISRLERGHSAFCEALVTLGETDRLELRPDGGGRTPRELAAHILACERIARAGAERILREDDPQLETNPFTKGDTSSLAEVVDLDLRRLVRLLESEREQTLALLARQSRADLDRMARLPDGNRGTLQTWLEMLATHDGEHTQQLIELLHAARPR